MFPGEYSAQTEGRLTFMQSNEAIHCHGSDGPQPAMQTNFRQEPNPDGSCTRTFHRIPITSDYQASEIFKRSAFCMFLVVFGRS